MKECFKCGEEKPLSEFYKHKQMGDGHLNKCKLCTKKDVKEHREKNIDRIREYDRNRGNRFPPGYLEQYRERYPQKVKAMSLVNYHIKRGNLVKKPCEVCGSSKHLHAHHDDYAEPLNVRFLCAAHHHQWHAENGEGLNGENDGNG